ncbi:MAG: glutamine-hydrolyzing carbamoyl-phosphate synthase small subunit [Treponema sp.]|nr:glutamine-hydrolyzing carbamoyl-phosphate synthase small subunit [Treponema sp.]
MNRPTKPLRQAALVLEDGSEFPGWTFGRARSQSGEVVFTTGMSGYPQSLTDPSFRGQILVSTYPLVGNYGVPVDKSGEAFLDGSGIPCHFESARIQVSGFVVAELCTEPSHFASGMALSGWLEKNNVPGICGVDTRALTKRLREHGVMMGKILVEGKSDVTFDSGIVAHPVAEVSPAEAKIYLPQGVSAEEGEKLPRVAMIDCGAKANILRCLLARRVKVFRLPWNHDFADSDLAVDGIFLSNGPGDPKDCGKTIASLRRAFSLGKPVFGICLGNQIMALAAGGDTYKLPYGHRGQNQPCVELNGHKTGRCYITSQNHGYAVRRESLPSHWEPWFINGNDGTIEGIRSTKGPFSAVQFHPEGCPGPRDTEFLIDRFVEQVQREQ